MKDKPTILFITSENTTTSIPLELATYMRKSDKIYLHIVSFYGAVPDEPLSSAKDIINLNVHQSNIKEGFSKVNKLIKEIKPDVIHVHHNLSALISLLAARFNKVSLLVKTEHNDHRFMKWHQKIFNIPILFLADVVICNSVSTKNSFNKAERLLAAKKTVPIYNGININKILWYATAENRRQIREKYGIASNEKLFVCAARLIEQKNFKILIKGFANATYANQNIRLLIAGSGHLYDSLLALKQQYDTLNKIQFLKILPREEVYKLMNAADFYIMLSLWEGFCNAIVEAMVAKCPVICSDIITLREVVGEEAGYFLHPESETEVTNAILQFAAFDDAAINVLKEKSFKRAAELFDIENTAKLYIDQYLKVNSYEKENHLHSRV